MKKMKSIYDKTKRFFDLVTASLLGLTLSPVLIAIAIAVKATSKGPVFYRWPVVGEEGRYFTGYKFRSMFQNTEHLKEKLLLRNEMTGPMFKLSDDPRITPVGKFLRKFSL
ncbi:sugar transferase, partial [bacterium]|nr:sugar transferase [bacterium]